MENQSRLTSSKEVIAFLANTFPQCFSAEGEARPLKIGIFQDLVTRLQGQMSLSRTQLRNALRQYTASWRYLYGLKPGAVRIDLDGNPCGELEQQHVEFARKQLEEAKTRVQARRQEQHLQQESSQQPSAQQKQDNANHKTVTDKRSKAQPQSTVQKVNQKKSGWDKVVGKQRTGTNVIPCKGKGRVAIEQVHQTTTSHKQQLIASQRPVALVDLNSLRSGQQVKIRIGKNETEATVLDVAKEGVRVSLASGMLMLVRAEHVVC